MDASFFRYVLKEIKGVLVGSRVEKIYNPLDLVWSFKISKKTNLIFKYGAKDNFVFLSKNRPQNPLRPGSQVGWWRKRVLNRWIEDILVDWPKRLFVIKLSHRDTDSDDFIIFDLKNGLKLTKQPPPIPDSISWPPINEIIQDKQIYKRYPHITSPFRYNLLELDIDFQKKFYKDFIEENIKEFYVYEIDENVELSLWKRSNIKGYKENIFKSANDAAEYYGWSILNKLKDKEINLSKRLKRAEKRLEKERQKLEKWLKLGKMAILIQQNLHQFDINKHYDKISVTDENGSLIDIELDASLSLIENMNKMFKMAKKAKRGLDYLETKDLEKVNIEDYKKRKNRSLQKIPLPSRISGLKVKVYKSSDGYFIVSGKNQEANHKLLSFGATSHDLWLHASGGPGAHVIIVRDNPKKEIPQRTLEEAAVIAGRFSYQRDSDYLEVIYSEVRYIKKIKGKPLGEVEVTKVLGSLLVKNDSSIEKLRIY